jgi:lysyl-tRNA synthetase class 1
MSKKGMHWADQMAETWIQRRGQDHVVEIGVSPSGPIHIGFLRETVLGAVAVRALRDAGAHARLILFVDSMDPLRKRYPFLDESFDRHIGRALCDIPAPWPGENSYADTFLMPFVRSLEALGIDLEIIRSEERYREGFFTRQITLALEHQERIAEILRDESGRLLDEDWAPVNPIDRETGKMTGTRVLSFDAASTTIEYETEDGRRGVADYSKGEAKLPWRIDWPARWNALGVTVEPFGKDHASPGGSFSTGRRICKEIFGSPAPEPVPYEWINLKGQGAMSSSKGIAIPIDAMVEVIPPEVLRYLIVRNRPNQAIDFDPSLKMIQIVDEFENLERRILHPVPEADAPSESSRRNYALARIRPEEKRTPATIPFRLLTTLVQVAAGDLERLKEVLVRTGYGSELERWDQVAQLARYAERWIEKFAPEEDKMQLSAEMPAAARSLSAAQGAFLKALSEFLDSGPSAEAIHQGIYTLAEQLQIQSPEAFKAIYLALIGKEKGPRAGFFLASLDREFVKKRFSDVCKAVL